MSELTEKLHVAAVGALCPADIRGDACDGCPHNKVGTPGVLLTGCTREAAALLFEDCRIVPAGAEDEPETDILLERQAGLLQRLDAELSEALTRIKKHCEDCRDFRGSGPAQCLVCELLPYKEPDRWKTELVGDLDEDPKE